MTIAVVPSTEPLTLAAGDSWRWDKTVTAYPPSGGWTLKYQVRSTVSTDTLAITASANSTNTGYQISVPGSSTQSFADGAYEWQAYVEGGASERYTVDRGVFDVRPNLVVASRESHDAIMIPLLQAAIQARVTVDMKSYTLTTIAATREDLEAYQRMLSRAKANVLRKRFGGMLPDVGAVFRAR